MPNKEVVLITGANTGIGFEAVKALASTDKPYHIFLGSRSVEKGQEAINEVNKTIKETKSTIELLEVDLTSDESIHKAYETVQSKVDRLDILVNNAGASFDGHDFAKDLPSHREIFNKAYDVNVSGTHILTGAFAPLLLKSTSPRLLFLTSGLSTLTGQAERYMPPYGTQPAAGWPKVDLNTNLGYRASKAAMNMVMLTWHWLLKDDGVRTWAISPGFLVTGLGGDPEFMRKWGAADVSLGGDIIRRVIEGERDNDVGKIVRRDGVTQDW